MSSKNLSQTAADFFSEDYRLSSTIDARRNSLGDLLYDPTTSYLTVEGAYISPIDFPSRISGNFPTAVIVKESITFALTSNQNTVFRRDQKYGQYYAPRLSKIFIALPYFEITGDLLLPGRTTTEILLTTKTEGFLTLLDVTATVVSKPEITYRGEACIVSKSKVSFVGLMEK